MTRPDQQPPPVVHRTVSGPLKDCVVMLAGLPDDDSRISTHLISIARLTADRATAVDYASITARREGAYTTVATSSRVALAVDEAQYADDGGPCLQALDTGTVTDVPDIGATMIWPGFRDAAFGLGLRASLSIPLFAGRGNCVAALNLYSHDPAPMAVLTAAVWETYETGGHHAVHTPDGLDGGGAELVAGLAGAFSVRDVIQQAIGLIIAELRDTPDAAYLALRLHSVESGASLLDTATSVIARHD